MNHHSHYMHHYFPQARAKYLMVAKQMKAYEDQLYEQWKENVQAVLQTLLKRNLLIKPDRTQVTSIEQTTNNDEQDEETGK